MVKCSVCRERIEETFLNKIKGTYIDKKPICNNCQKKITIEEIRRKI